MFVIIYNNFDEVIEIVNDIKYGFVGYVIGKDKDILRYVVCLIEVGIIEINEVGRKLDLLFGGYKEFGLGCEWGDYGIEEFLEVKLIVGYFK